MPNLRFQGFIGPSYTLRSVNLDCQRCVNFYPEVNEMGTGKEREVMALMGTPGLRLLFDSSSDGPCRGVYTTKRGNLFVVFGSKLYSISSNWVKTHIGTLITSEGPVSMADNGVQLIIVDGPNGYIYDLSFTTPMQKINAAGFYGGNRVSFQDGYFIVPKPDTGELHWCALYDGLSWDALNFVTAEGSPDNLVTAVSDHREVWMFGSETTEVYFNSGGFNTFERIQGAFIEYGCAAPFTPLKVNDAIMWLTTGQNGHGIVMKSVGYKGQRISNHCVETAIQRYGDLSNTVAWTYQDDGHPFYCLTFEHGDVTWVYDDATGLWHERTYRNPQTGAQQRHRVSYHAFAYTTHVVGDYELGKLYALDKDVYTDVGDPIKRVRSSPHVSKNLNRLKHTLFQLDLETGVGLDGSQQGTDPKIMLDFSDDGGHTWSNEILLDAGKVGLYTTRALARRLGVSRDRVYRISTTDPIKMNLIGAQLGLEEGLS